MAHITTTKGSLEIRTGGIDNENEKTDWIEYWLGGDVECPHPIEPDAANPNLCLKCNAERIHRSVNMVLKKHPAGMEAVAGKLFRN